MKIILSRKGFDNQYGKQPSPILPDGTLLSLPIPMEGESTSFSALNHKGQSYFQLIKTLKPNTHLKATDTCHLDPDIIPDCIDRNNRWSPLFGQYGSALGHLLNNTISKDDLFLFFGTFRETEFVKDQLRYKPNAPDIHVMYGYLQVEAVHVAKAYLEQHFAHHPHAKPHYTDKKLNGIFVAKQRCSFDASKTGANTFRFHKDLVLTKEGYSKSRWKLPAALKDATISYHSESSFKADYFQSAAKGQEFIISGSKAAERWAVNLVKQYASG